MLDAKTLAALPELPPPILTLYLDTNPAKARNQGRPSGARIWLKSRKNEIGADLPQQERKRFKKQLERVEKFLDSRSRSERGIVIFAGPRVWRVLPLQVDVENEMDWGRPSLKQLLWLLDEYQPSGIVTIDRSGARFFRSWMGELEERSAQLYSIDTSQWRQKSGVRPARLGQRKTSRSERDAFEQRVETRYSKIFKNVAKRIEEWAQEEELDPVFLAGAQAAIDPVMGDLISSNVRDFVVVKGDYAQIPASDLERKIAPKIAKWKRSREAEDATEIIANGESGRAVLGVSETLSALQRGHARELIVSRGITGRLLQCANCGWTDRSVDPVCAICGGERHLIGVREALPELAQKFGVPVEVVAGRAAGILNRAGGLAAWLTFAT
ncbi:MAG: VLRF1 family aeRF1-type release factor [Terracidiphilus sp.]